MSFVVDASVVVAWAFEEEHTIAEEALARIRSEEAAVPALWWYELRNVLMLGERRGRLTERAMVRFLQDLSRLAITIDFPPDETQVLAFARRQGLTLYDAAYLELAVRKAWPLATLDQELASAAQAEGVSLISQAT